MSCHDHTRMGGTVEEFETTLWGVICEIESDDDASSRALIGDLLNRYWRPVYCYLRRKGYDNERAKDLTQGFFQEVVLGRKLIQQADRTKGRFRTFLLHALNRYLSSVHRKQTAKKRIPDNKIVPWELIDAANLLEPVSRLTAEESFNYAWLCSLLDRVLAEVESECLARGMKAHWQVFHDRVLQPIRQNNSAPSLSKICDRYRIESATKASNMIITVNRRFQAALRRHLRQSVASDVEVTSELWELMDIFPKNRAG